VTITFTSPEGKGSGTVFWDAIRQTDVIGFNVVTIDPKGTRVQLNTSTIPCEGCATGQNHRYATIIPKHKSGHNVFVEMLRPGTVQVYGPAVRQ
jgi:hypothetical protein